MRIGILFANYGPYHVARFGACWDAFAGSGLEPIAIELAQQEATYPWQVDRAALPFEIVSVVEDQPLEAVSLLRLHRRLWRQLGQLQLDGLAIAGYAHPAMVSALAWCRLRGKLAILMSETKADDTARPVWKEAPKRWLVSQFQAALVGGSCHRDYLVALGMNPAVIFSGYDVVDNATFHPEHIRTLPRPLPRPYFLTVNRFVPKKNLARVLTAYAAYCQRVPEPWDLVLCGDGPLRADLTHQVQGLGLADRVHLPGFLQQADLLPYFAHAGAFLHASVQEQWGLVVNEAMAAGLPVVVSRRCGCYGDLIQEGRTGFGFDPEDPDQLTDRLVYLSGDECDRAALSAAALTHIQQYSPAAFATGLRSAIQAARS